MRHLIGGFLAAVTLLAGACAAGEETAGPLTIEARAELFQKSLIGVGPALGSLASAGLRQWRNDPGEWGPGAAGFARRFAGRYGTRVVSNSLEFGLGAIIREDPRYFRSPKTGWSRVGDALKMTFVAPQPGGGRSFAYARMAGAFGGAALSNAWYPESYRTAGNTLARAGVTIGGDVAGNIFKEFLPDLKRKLLRR